MPSITVRSSVDRAEVGRLLLPRDDVVAERAVDAGRREAGRFGLADGPFVRYERRVWIIDEGPGGRRRRGVRARGGDAPGGPVVVVEDIDFALPPGTWRFLMNWPVRRALRHRRDDGKQPWWYPPQRPDARAATVLGLLATLSLIIGYHGTLLGRTMTFAADEFGVGSTAQGVALAAARVGGVLAIGLGALADRRGRRLILLAALLICIGSTVAGALSPNLATLAATQAVNRGAWSASALLLAVIAAEEMPAGARAYALSLLSMTGALGAGVALWLLPIADVGPRAWRLLYLVPLLFLPVVAHFGRRVPESRRFVRAHRNVPLAGHYRRLVLVAGIWLLFNVFGGPQSQFLVDYLHDERGMSAVMISLFIIATSTPASIGIVVGGRLADTRGRRIVGATAASVGAVLTALSFAVGGGAMWLTALLGTVVLAAMVPAISVFGPELFPTSLRGRANAIVSLSAMGGSAIGLIAVGWLQERLGSFGPAMAVVAVAPLLMALILVAFFPETARRELEDINPEDDLGPPPDAARPTRSAGAVTDAEAATGIDAAAG